MPEIGFLAHPWWVPVAYVAVLGHLTNICVTLYLHRSMTHQGVVFHPLAAHAMRLWLWLTTGMNTREWVAVHRKHHAFADREGDPHSPAVEGFWAILLAGVFFYRRAVKDQAMLEKYGAGCPDDWVERNVYSRHGFGGIVIMLLVDVLLFGVGIGLVVWSCMAVWVPIMGNIINGAGHALGYRNFDTRDESRNLYPLGIWIVGEELHNNHHADPRSAKFKAHWWEFDIGWAYIRLLSLLRLARVVYARSITAREFAERYYAKKSREYARKVKRVSETADRAVNGLEEVLGLEGGRVDRAEA
ncbi:MAG TPA: fatty acid desaturase [Longimicrobiales bacterium]